MRLVYLHQYFNPRGAVGSTRSYEFAKRLADNGHDVHVISTTRTGEYYRNWSVEAMEGFHVHSIYVPYTNAMTMRQRMVSFLKYALRAGRRARNIKADVVYATSTPLTVAIPAAVATAFRKTPQVFEVRDLWPEVPIAMGALQSKFARFAAYSLQRFAYNRSSHIVALSPDMKSGIIARGYDSDSISIIPNSSDLALFESDSQETTDFRGDHPWLLQRHLILYFGTVGRVNDVGFIIRMAKEALALKPEYRFLIIGDGSERARLESESIAANVLHRNLYMFDPVPKTELKPILKAATITVSTVAPIRELWANSANKFFDSLAAGRPIAINHEGWQADVLRRTQAGLVLDSSDPKAALLSIADLIEDPVRLEDSRKAAADLARNKYSRDAHADELEKVLLETYKRSRGF